MGTIGGIGSYYQLANLLSSGSGSSTASNLSSSGTPSLSQLLDSVESSSSASGASSYLLDLSPAAQQLLSGTSTQTNSSSGSGSSFVLSKTQQTAIQNIIEKYKDAPLTQATFEDIQNALAAAGLSPQKLGAEDQVTSFNPTNVLLSALNGNYTPIGTPQTSASQEQTKETNYIQNIVKLWKADSATASSASGASTTGT